MRLPFDGWNPGEDLLDAGNHYLADLGPAVEAADPHGSVGELLQVEVSGSPIFAAASLEGL